MLSPLCTSYPLSPHSHHQFTPCICSSQHLHQSTTKLSERPPHHASTPCAPPPLRPHPSSHAEVKSCEGEHFQLDKACQNYGSSLPVLFEQEVIAETYKEANSQVNIAVQLVRKAYSRNERVRSNCSGKANKLLLSPRRLAAVKKAVHGIHPVRPGQKEKDAWRPYRLAIDSSCRQLNRPTNI